ncbi:TDT family transporter [Streptomyces sp. SAJ15]|uniref:TDT family transporter n=1 Tax=Streptomyces sp. SAJ15 TaxID=2011095 RepID=UPI00118643B6|nr:TDT family transporter [Streptomyces sp. SAJ15]TVL90459.1 C4-dicarboxylate ABC transporter [Streptomyces sp. SAJ15]
MSVLAPPGALPRTTRTAPARRHRPRASVRHLGPNWYAVVMGTAIVANAGVALPVRVPRAEPVFVAVWALSALALLVLLAARAAHWLRHRDQARAHLLDPTIAPFYGCPPMALLAVGAGALAVGGDVIGPSAAVTAGAVLWSAGSMSGLMAAVGVPYLMIARHRIAPGDASPVWLLPVVAPMVAAATGPALAAHLPPGQGRSALLLGCCAMFGMSLLATLLILPAVFARLVHRGPLPLALSPALFLVLGPLGQSTTAGAQLADAVHGTPFGPYAAYASVAYGAPVLGFALLWLALAGALVVRAARREMPFAMTWWGFTFPVGTCVTGAAGLARHTGVHAVGWLAVGLYGLLLAAWAIVAFRTGLGLARGTLLAPGGTPGAATTPPERGGTTVEAEPGAGAATPQPEPAATTALPGPAAGAPQPEPLGAARTRA